MIRSAPLLIFALTLGGCCLSGNCYAPMAEVAPRPAAASASAATAGPVPTVITAAPIAGSAEVTSANPDGLVTTSANDGQEEYLPPPAGKASTKPKKSVASRSDGDASASPRSRGEEAYEEQMAADRAADEQLKRKLIICQNCSTKGNVDNN